ncbi:MAG: DMT family transporter [Bacteriovoracia bacterium]
MSSKAASPVIVTLALILVQVIFGVNYVLSKIIVGVFPPLVWAALRVICSAIIMLFINILFNKNTPRWDRHFFLPLLGFSLLGMTISQGSFLLGLSHTTSTNSSILNTLIPVFTLVIVTVQGREPLTISRSIGFFCAFVGVLVIRKVEDFSFSNQTLLGDMLVMLNALSTALFLALSKKFIQKYDRLWVTTWLFIYGSVGLSLVALPEWATFKLPAMTVLLWSCAAFGVIGTILTYFLSNWALAHTHSSQVALFIYLQPIVASFLAWLALGEKITFRVILSCSLISFGVLTALTPPDFFSRFFRRKK